MCRQGTERRVASTRQGPMRNRWPTSQFSGTPRVVNIVCDHCLLSGYADSKRRIDTGVVEEAIDIVACMRFRDEQDDVRCRRQLRRTAFVQQVVREADAEEEGAREEHDPEVFPVVVQNLVRPRGHEEEVGDDDDRDRKKDGDAAEHRDERRLGLLRQSGLRSLSPLRMHLRIDSCSEA